MKDSTRRRFVRMGGFVCITGVAGCSQTPQIIGENDIKDTDGDGVIDSEDYAPRDASVQDAEDVREVDSTEQGGEDEDQPTVDEDQSTETPIDEQSQILGEPIAHYGFEGTDEIIQDRTNNGHNGQLRSVNRVSGRGGQVLDISSGEYAAVGTADSLNPGEGTYTCGLWFRTILNPDANYKNRQALLVKRADTDALRWHFILHNGKVQLDLNDGSNGGRVRSKQTFIDGEWHHTVAVWDNETVLLYVDGERRDQQELSLGSISPPSPVYLGAQPEYPKPLYYSGQLDDVIIYDTALSAAEVQQLYTSFSN
jgi:hypothetical protein